MNVYENVKKIYGPYLGKDNRLRLCLVFNDDRKISISYPKYLIEKHLNRYLDKNETVDHIDKNPLNNDISNLRVLSRKEHCSNDVIRNKDVIVNCSYCGKQFTIPGNKLHYRNRKDRLQTGYFCSRQCSGKYGKEIQLGIRKKELKDSVIPEKYSNHKSASDENQNVESP